MGRLTWKNPNGDWGIKGVELGRLDGVVYGALCKLLDYENTGLSPIDVDFLKYEADYWKGKHRWIPVTERLPDNGESVLVTVSQGYTTYGYYDLARQEWWKHDEDGMLDAIAWMPLPAPYERRNPNA